MVKILIADSSSEFRIALAGALQSRYLVESCGDGAQALSLLQSDPPDILVLDLMLPEVDGLAVIKQAAEAGICPTLLVTSRYFRDYVIDTLHRYQVACAVLKPCRIQNLADRIQDLAEQIVPALPARPTPRSAITTALLAMNFPTKQKGFTYIREAVLMLAQDPGQQVTKEIYPVIGKAHGSNFKAVERAIRHSINCAWNQSDREVWRRYFPTAPNGQVPKPTNSAFLSRLADMVQQFPQRKAQ